MRIEAKLRNAALAYAPLAALLGNTAQSFRWYETQLVEGSAFPAVVVMLISNARDYAFQRRMATSFSRVQFTIWDTDPTRASQIEETLVEFLDQFNAYGISGLSQNANFVLNSRSTIYPDTQPPNYQRIIDAKLFDNQLI